MNCPKCNEKLNVQWRRENIARAICKVSNPSHPYDAREQVYKDIFLRYADAIISADINELLEVIK